MPRYNSQSPEERARNLQMANEVRYHRARMKRRLADGEITFTELLDDTRCGGMLVEQALCAIPMVGTTKAATVMRRAGIAPSAKIGRLTTRQRVVLLYFLSRYPKVREFAFSGDWPAPRFEDALAVDRMVAA